MIEIRTSCDTCSQTRKDDPIQALPPGTIGGFRDCVRWPELETRPPSVGQRHRLEVGFPFLASEEVPFWVLFQPSTPDAPPEALALIRCQLRADLGAYQGDWPDGLSYRPERVLEVEVLEVVPLLAVPEVLPADPHGPFDAYWDSLFDSPGSGCSAHVTQRGPYTYFEVDLQGDVGAIAICVVTPAGRSVVLYSTWSLCGEGWFDVLNYPLDDDAYQDLRDRFTEDAP